MRMLSVRLGIVVWLELAKKTSYKKFEADVPDTQHKHRDVTRNRHLRSTH
jgi:hypothetical protein